MRHEGLPHLLRHSSIGFNSKSHLSKSVPKSIKHLRRKRCFGFVVLSKGTNLLKALTEHLVGKLLKARELSLGEALFEIRRFQAM